MATRARDTWGPAWPEIRSDGITAAGFGDQEGDKPCFTTEYNHLTIYLPHSLVSDLAAAQAILAQIVPTLDDMWPNCDDRYLQITVGTETWDIELLFAFSHLLIRRLTAENEAEGPKRKAEAKAMLPRAIALAEMLDSVLNGRSITLPGS